MCFPQLIAGPIVRYKDVAEEIEHRKISVTEINIGIRRFIVGLGKKVILADMLAVIADNLFSASEYMQLPVVAAWIGAIAYTLEIYFDFSGYSDMAIGLAGMFGFRYKENFNYPYISRSIGEFWKRWHISLTDWFRDYVYIPLGGNRVSRLKNIFNLSVVWILTGIWHGANWTFLLWGCIYLVLQVVEKLFIRDRHFPVFFSWFTTMMIVTCNWVIFRSPSIGSAINYLKSMFMIFGTWMDSNALYYATQSIGVIILGMICCVPWKSINFIRRMKNHLIINYVIRDLFLVAIFLISLLMVIHGNYSPFIYYMF